MADIATPVLFIESGGMTVPTSLNHAFAIQRRLPVPPSDSLQLHNKIPNPDCQGTRFKDPFKMKRLALYDVNGIKKDEASIDLMP